MTDAKIGFYPRHPAMDGREFGQIEAALVRNARIGDQGDVGECQ